MKTPMPSPAIGRSRSCFAHFGLPPTPNARPRLTHMLPLANTPNSRLCLRRAVGYIGSHEHVPDPFCAVA